MRRSSTDIIPAGLAELAVETALALLAQRGYRPAGPDVHVVLRAAAPDCADHQFVITTNAPPTLDQLALHQDALDLVARMAAEATARPQDSLATPRTPTEEGQGTGSPPDDGSMPLPGGYSEDRFARYGPAHAATRTRLERATRTGSAEDRRQAAEDLQTWLAGGPEPA